MLLKTHISRADKELSAVCEWHKNSPVRHSEKRLTHDLPSVKKLWSKPIQPWQHHLTPYFVHSSRCSCWKPQCYLKVWFDVDYSFLDAISQITMRKISRLSVKTVSANSFCAPESACIREMHAHGSNKLLLNIGNFASSFTPKLILSCLLFAFSAAFPDTVETLFCIYIKQNTGFGSCVRNQIQNQRKEKKNTPNVIWLSL